MTNFKYKIITFANNTHKICRDELISELKKIGFTDVISYDENDISEDFKNQNSKLFSYSRGYGYWVWKPYLIKKTLENSKDDEIIVYIDSTDLPKKEFVNFLDKHFISNDILLFNNIRHEKHDVWTKSDCFVLMDCDDEKFHNQIQLEAGVIGMKKTKFNLDLTEEWLNYCCNINIVTDEPNICGKPNHSSFIEHRHDQSILTNLRYKYNLISVDSSENLVQYNFSKLQRLIKRY